VILKVTETPYMVHGEAVKKQPSSIIKKKLHYLKEANYCKESATKSNA